LLVAPILDAYKGEVFAALYSVTEQQTALLVEPFHAAPEIAAAQLTRVAEGRALEIGLEAQGSRLQVRDHASLKSKFSGGSPERAAPLCIHVLGSGYRRYAERIAPQWDARAIVVLDPRWDAPHARHIAREARRLLRTEGASDVARLAPLYVRDSDAQLPKAPLRL
jgi:tRNA A37 threonylcarbamoyladenosine modification protein TsaB